MPSIAERTVHSPYVLDAKASWRRRAETVASYATVRATSTLGELKSGRSGVVMSPERLLGGDEICRVMEERVNRVLGVAALHGHEVLVLGASGCGVFRNAPGMIAELFHQAITGRFRGVFTHVVFAVLDPRGETIGSFEQVFGPATLR
jgi:hypothetical protein